jgi:hypothetical protein
VDHWHGVTCGHVTVACFQFCPGTIPPLCMPGCSVLPPSVGR